MTEQPATDQQEPAEQLQITPPRTYVNAGMAGNYATKWTSVRDGANDNQRFVSRGNLT